MERISMKKYQLLFKIVQFSLTYFFVFGLSQMTLIVQNYWQFSSQIWQFRLDSQSLEFAIFGVMIWILVKTGHGYLFHIPKNGFGIRF